MNANLGIFIIASILIIFSLVLNYYIFVVEENFDIFTLPNGPDTTDYFVEEL